MDKAQISEDGNKFDPIYINDEETDKNAIIFYELEYGKQYELKIESGNYSITKTFIYQKNDDIFNELEIGNMDIKLEETKQDEDKPSEDTPETEIPGEDKPSENTPEIDTPGEDKPNENNPETDTPEEDGPIENIPEINKPSEDDSNIDTTVTDNQSKENSSKKEKQEESNLEETDKLAPYKIPKTGDNNWLQIILITNIVLIVIVNGILIYKIHKTKQKNV